MDSFAVTHGHAHPRRCGLQYCQSGETIIVLADRVAFSAAGQFSRQKTLMPLRHNLAVLLPFRSAARYSVASYRS
jgi:hypothetical protein